MRPSQAIPQSDVTDSGLCTGLSDAGALTLVSVIKKSTATAVASAVWVTIRSAQDVLGVLPMYEDGVVLYRAFAWVSEALGFYWTDWILLEVE